VKQTVVKLEVIGGEVWRELWAAGFPLFGIPLYAFVLLVLFLFALLILWNLVGKGRGSHAGREEVRRAYRRKLAQEMAHQDAEKIKLGEKPRRRWMQW
jgi:hypothetical protein